jgi:L-lysine exporter family protein LysE/ArgO
MVTSFIHGVILAFGLILPLGVQNVYVFTQGFLQRHYWNVLPVVLVASVVDTFFIVLAVTGVSLLVLASAVFKWVMLVVGVVFLTYMGIQSWRSEVQTVTEGAVADRVRKQVVFALSVSLLNPHVVLDTVGVIGTSSLQYEGNAKVAFTVATIVVSWLWFFGLALAGRMVGKLDQTGVVLRWLNKVSALVMWAAAVYMVWLLVIK